MKKLYLHLTNFLFINPVSRPFLQLSTGFFLFPQTKHFPITIHLYGADIQYYKNLEISVLSFTQFRSDIYT